MNHMGKYQLDLSKEFAGRRALVTGGSRGIGAAIAQRLLDGGAKVVVTARSRHEQTPAGATFIQGDIRTPEGCKKIGEEAIKILGGLDILVNNAAAARVIMTGSEGITPADWQETIASNFLSAVYTTNSVLPELKKSSAGAIVNISSGSDLPGNGILVHYGASKAALNYYSKALAKDLGAAHKIRVNTVTPGGVETPGADVIRNELMAAMGAPPEAAAQMVPLGRLGKVEDISEMAVYLLSPRASWITGQNFFVNGGLAF
jgi:NAD(P)-dependent dehydrogenase (short-subunit alcohol dehydrogenase family)